jgi:hypothetical protein
MATSASHRYPPASRMNAANTTSTMMAMMIGLYERLDMIRDLQITSFSLKRG